MATTANESETLLRRTIEALDEQDRDGFAATQAEDVVLHHPRETYRGVDEVVAFQWGIFDAFSDLTFAVEAVVTDGQTVAARWTASGTHDGEFRGVPPTGEEVEIPTMAMMRVVDGAIAEAWLRPDLLALQRQLGVEPTGR